MKTLRKSILWIWFFCLLASSIFYYRPSLNKQEQDAALVEFMTHGYSKEQHAQFMEIAQRVADQDKVESIGLQQYERAFVEIKYGRLSKFHKFLYKRCKSLDAIAYHEAGHTILTVHKNCGRDLKWTSIQLCTSMFGYVYTLDYHKKTYHQKTNTIMMLLAGGAGEQIFKGKKFTTIDDGFADLVSTHTTTIDVQQARNLVQEMIANKEIVQQNVDGVLKKYYAETVAFLTQHQDDLKVIAQALLEKKFLSCHETYELLRQSAW